MREALRLTISLSALVLLSGCSGTLWSARTANQVTVEIGELCKSWRHKEIDKDDKLTQKTAMGIEGDNHSRTEWGCEYGRNQPKAEKEG